MEIAQFVMELLPPPRVSSRPQFACFLVPLGCCVQVNLDVDRRAEQTRARFKHVGGRRRRFRRLASTTHSVSPSFFARSSHKLSRDPVIPYSRNKRCAGPGWAINTRKYEFNKGRSDGKWKNNLPGPHVMRSIWF